MAAKKYRWPGSSALHTVSWEDQKKAVAARRPGAAAAAPATGPDGPAGPLASPVDTTYLGQTESLRNQRDQSIAASRQQRDATLLDYGYTGTFDPTTDQLTGLTLDLSNPFAKASVLKRTYDISRSSAGNRMASTGGLYQGAYQNQQDLINRGQLQAEDALQTSLTSWLANNAAAIGQARTNYETGVSAAAGDATDRAANLQNPNYQPTIPGGSAAAVGGTGLGVGGVGTPVTKTNKPRTPSLSGQTLTAGPNVKQSPGTRVTTTTTKKGGKKTATHTTRVTRA